MSTTDTSTLNYVIDQFDEQNLIIQVSFPEDGTTAAIGLSSIPESQDELDAIVKPFGTHLEIADTIAAVKPADLTFLKSRVGVETTTTRFSQADHAAVTVANAAAMAATQAAAAPLSANEFSVTVGAVPTEAQLAEAQLNDVAADKEYIKQLIAEVLAEQKA